MSPRFARPLARVAMTLASAAALLACGGRSDYSSLGLGDVGGGVTTDDGGTCAVLPCPPNAPWNPAICACEAVDDAGQPIVADATVQCQFVDCPQGSVLTVVGGSCLCYGLPEQDAGSDVTVIPSDAPYYYYDSPYMYPAETGTFYPPADAPYYYYPDTGVAVGPPETGAYCPYYYYNYNPCGAGYTLGPSCTCEICSSTCPLGEMPGPGCTGCTTCTTTCPAGFDYGPSCTCVPHGVDAGPPVAPDAAGDAGVSCLIEGYRSCAAGSWCQLGTCPNGTTQYGCYCDQAGNATCSLACPVPPPCTIPGQASCPYGQQCVYGSCASNPSGDLLICSCNNSYGYYGGDSGSSPSAYCYTTSCADGGPQYLPEAGPPAGSVTCLFEGYVSCAAGSWCPVGTCPGGTQYGCSCNQDGTSTCDLTCPPAPDCQIPGEGTCPYGTSCVFGCGSSGNATGLSCYCGWGGTANCNTVSCSQYGGGG